MKTDSLNLFCFMLDDVYIFLTEEHSDWDTWGLGWRKNNRPSETKKVTSDFKFNPDAELSENIWILTMGYLDAVKQHLNEGNPAIKRAEFRCELASMGTQIAYGQYPKPEQIKELHKNIMGYFTAATT